MIFHLPTMTAKPPSLTKGGGGGGVMEALANGVSLQGRCQHVCRADSKVPSKESK